MVFTDLPLSQEFKALGMDDYLWVQVSQIQTLTSKITQICQDIHHIKLRQLLITRSKEEPIVITKNILTNQNNHKDTLGSDRSRPETPGIHEGCAEDGNDYVYRTPNRHELGNQDNLQRHDTYQPQQPPRPSGMTPEPLPYPDPSEASETPSSVPTSLLSPPKKDDIEPAALSMNMERPDLSWNLCLAPTKRNGRAELEEESETREGTGLRWGGASPCREFGRGTGIGAAQPDRMDSEAEPPLSTNASAR